MDVLLRAAHVLVISVLFGGTVFGVLPASLVSWQHLVLLSGGALIVSEVLHELRWPVQGRGLVVYLHTGLFVLAWLRPGLAIPALLAALLTGMVGSHMPKRLRYWSFVRER